MIGPEYDVMIVGAGPAGLSAARALLEAGPLRVLVLERNPEAGGLPRFCGHLGWGLFDHHRIVTGQAYARELVRRAREAEIATDAALVRLEGGGRALISTRGGMRTVEARAILLTTGIRETPRGPRLISGNRPWGVTTTGAFQELVYAGGVRPFRRPVIIGSELVAFSALLTARHAGVRPVAIIEAGPRIAARYPGGLIARWGFGVDVRTATRFVSIDGRERVEAVQVEHVGRRETIACDGAIFSGLFVPEVAAVQDGAIAIDLGTGGPVIDNFWRCSDPSIFAAGNVLRAVEHSGIAAREGRAAAAAILRSLADELPSAEGAIVIRPAGALKYMYPQRLVPDDRAVILYGRSQVGFRGTLRLKSGATVLVERCVDTLPERRLKLFVPAAVLRRLGDGERNLEAVLE